MSKKHHTVIMRMNNLRTIREWIDGKKPEELTPEYRKAILRKTMINLGVTRSKAREYISLVMGDEE